MIRFSRCGHALSFSVFPDQIDPNARWLPPREWSASGLNYKGRSDFANQYARE